MVNIILHMVLILCQCMILVCLVRIKRYLGGIDSGQEETNEYLSDIRKILKGNAEKRGDKNADSAN